jgi:hypothetical protein
MTTEGAVMEQCPLEKLATLKGLLESMLLDMHDVGCPVHPFVLHQVYAMTELLGLPESIVPTERTFLDDHDEMKSK